MLIPIIGQNKQAAETRLMKISNGMLVVIPRLMAVASQAVVQVEIRNAASEAEKLNEANRQITLLASKVREHIVQLEDQRVALDQTLNELREIERLAAETLAVRSR